MGDRIRNPQIGDLVVEDGARYPRRDPADTRLKGLGYLLGSRVEWSQTDEDHAAWLAEDPDAAGYPRSTVGAWYVQYGSQPDAICRWTNCSFVVVPIGRDMFREPVGTRDVNGVTITRADLLGSLADSGFNLNLPR